MPADYRRDSAGLDIVRTVYVEASGTRGRRSPRRLGSSHRCRTRLPSAVVAQAWLDRDDAAEVLGGQAARPIVRGIRHKPAAAARPQNAARRCRLDGRSAMAARLRAPRTAPAVLRPADAVVALSMPQRSSGATSRRRRSSSTTPACRPTAREGLAGWRRASGGDRGVPERGAEDLRSRAARPAWTVAANGPVIRDAIAIFGVERCMFASNFPVDGLAGTFAEIFTGFAQAVPTVRRGGAQEAVPRQRGPDLPALTGRGDATNHRLHRARPHGHGLHQTPRGGPATASSATTSIRAGARRRGPGASKRRARRPRPPPRRKSPASASTTATCRRGRRHRGARPDLDRAPRRQDGGRFLDHQMAVTHRVVAAIAARGGAFVDAPVSGGPGRPRPARSPSWPAARRRPSKRAAAARRSARRRIWARPAPARRRSSSTSALPDELLRRRRGPAPRRGLWRRRPQDPGGARAGSCRLGSAAGDLSRTWSSAISRPAAMPARC